MVKTLKVIEAVLPSTWAERAVQASFEAVRQNWGERSYLWQALQESWQEIDTMTRQELQRVHQNLVENTPVVQKLRSLFLQFTVGSSGLICVPNASRMDGTATTPAAKKAEKTAVESWNGQRGEAWERWARYPEINTDNTFATCTILWAGLLFDRGAILVNLTEESLANTKGVVTRRTPKIETIDPIRMKTPSGQTTYEGRPIIDGVEIDPVTGARVAGWIVKSDYSNTSTGIIPTRPQAELFTRILFYKPGMKGGLIFKFRPRFAGQIRELPEGFSAYNIIRDINNLMQLEQQCAKLAGEIATVEKNATGELSTRTNRQVGIKIPSAVPGTNPAGNAVTKSAFLDYNVSFGGKKIAMMQGDKLENFMVNRPTVAQQAYWDTLWTNVCMAYDQPKLLVMPYSLQGTVTRADLDVCANSYKFKFEVVREVCALIYEWQCQWAMDYDLTMPDTAPPDDACAVFIRPPRSPNVDLGYTAKALEIELRLGVKTLADVHAEKQQDWRQKMREAAEAIAYAKQLAIEYDCDAGQITELAVEQAIVEPKTDPAEGGNESTSEAREKSHVYA